jgi:hypothetical protein
VIVKIISGGQSGVDRAALDVAIRLSIPHGGWVPKGRLAEDGPLADKYNLRETLTETYAERTEKNVMDSDGTLIISRGALAGGSEYTRAMALQHGRPYLHIDLERTAAFQAALTIVEWISKNDIRALNVAGPRASKDPLIYRDATMLLESVCYLNFSSLSPEKASKIDPKIPQRPPAEIFKRVQDVVERLLEDLPLKDKVLVGNMSEVELPTLGRSLGEYIINRFGLATGNKELLRSCGWVARRPISDESQAAAVIIRSFWMQLRRTHRLRLIK